MRCMLLLVPSDLQYVSNYTRMAIVHARVTLDITNILQLNVSQCKFRLKFSHIDRAV